MIADISSVSVDFGAVTLSNRERGSRGLQWCSWDPYWAPTLHSCQLQSCPDTRDV